MPQSRHQKIRRLLLFGALGIAGILLAAWWFNKHGPNAAATATGTASGNVLGGGAGFGAFTGFGNDELGAGTSPGGGDGAAGQQLTGAGTGLGTALTLNIFSNAPATPTVTPVHTNPLIQPAPQAPAARAMPTAAAFVAPAVTTAAAVTSPPPAAQAPTVAWFQQAAPRVAAVAAAGPTRGYVPPPPVNNIGLPARTGTVGRPTTNVAQQQVRVPVNVTRNLAPSGGAATIGTRRF